MPRDAVRLSGVLDHFRRYAVLLELREDTHPAETKSERNGFDGQLPDRSMSGPAPFAGAGLLNKNGSCPYNPDNPLPLVSVVPS